MASVLAITGTEVAGWIIFGVAVLVGLFGAWMIASAGDRSNDDWMGGVGAGIAVIGIAVAVGTIGLRMAGQLPPEWIDDPFNL